jgi:hypothetical protein
VTAALHPLDVACATQYVAPADPKHTAHELRTIIEAAIEHQPRSLQLAIGPSELGNECERCLAHKLAGTPESRDAAWLPFIGTAVHEQLEQIILAHENTRASLGMPGRFLTENRVTVGQVGGVAITGSTDLFDTHTGTVIDWKCVGTTTLRKAKGSGASTVYRRQAHLYGKGWQDAGYTVNTVLIYFLPRNAVSLADGCPWAEPYDRADAEATLQRADNLAKAVGALGLEQVLAGLPPHHGDGFSCRRMPDYAPQVASSLDPSNPFG